MSKLALCGLAAVIALASSFALTGSPSVARAAVAAQSVAAAPNTPPPRNRRTARRILRADVVRLAHDYTNTRYRSICATDMTTRELRSLGGTSNCILKVGLINSLVPVRSFTITEMKLGRLHRWGTVTLYLNGNKLHRIHALAKWEGRAYRLDHESGWKPAALVGR
ncbi:MAG: hypothetical protein QOG85_1923 [Gaiellaceae bacterium]|jgi:hypothetical protein|nr:hypothetical protein [Gaiellaceae bacterium]